MNLILPESIRRDTLRCRITKTNSKKTFRNFTNIIFSSVKVMKAHTLGDFVLYNVKESRGRLQIYTRVPDEREECYSSVLSHTYTPPHRGMKG